MKHGIVRTGGILLCSALSAARLAGQQADVHGRVLDPNGTPLADAEIRVLPHGAIAITSDSGTFTFGPMADGTYLLMVRRLGFDPASPRVTVAPGMGDVKVTLSPLAVQLDTVVTQALAAELPRVFLRMHEKLGAMEVGQALESRYPGLSLPELLHFDERLSRVLMGGQHVPGCWDDIFIDDRKATPLDVTTTREKDIAAIEAFESPDFVHEPAIDGLYHAGSCRHIVLVWLKGYKQPPWAGH